MFKAQIVDSRNFRKTKFFKVFQVLLYLFFFFFFLLAYFDSHRNTTIGHLLDKRGDSMMPIVAIGLIIIVAPVSIMMRMRMKNVSDLGNLEMDGDGIKCRFNDNSEYQVKWGNTDLVHLEYFSIPNRKENPLGCMNYLTIADKMGTRRFEFIIESSLVKAELGEVLRQINSKVPVKIKYAIPIRKIIHDKDLKLY